MGHVVNRVDRAVNGEQGSAVLKIALLVIGITLTALLATATSYLSRMVTIAEQARHDNATQDVNIALLERQAETQSRVNADQKRVNEQTVQTLQAIGDQVTHLSDDVQNLKDSHR